MAAFELHQSPSQLTLLVGLAATADGGLVALFQTETSTTLPGGGTTVALRNNLTLFTPSEQGGLEQLGSDISLGNGNRALDDSFLPAFVVAQTGGGFGVYQTQTPFDGSSPTVELRNFDAIGVEGEGKIVVGPALTVITPLRIGFGATAQMATADALLEELRFFDTAIGGILSDTVDLAGLPVGNLFGLDAGFVMAGATTLAQTTLDQGFATTGQGALPRFNLPGLLTGAQLEPSRMFAAGNALVQVSRSFGADITETWLFDIVKPGDGAAGKTISIARPSSIQEIATAEIEGVGFAILSAFRRVGGSNPNATDASLMLFDFDGDLIGERRVSALTEAVFPNFQELRLIQLQGTDAIQLAPVWLDDQADTGLQQWMTEVFTFTPALNNSGTMLDDFLAGFARNDTLSGGAGHDLLLGRDGADSLDGGAGQDSLNGDDGSDSLTGASGNDVLSGGAEADTLSGGDGDDELVGQSGNDALDGGNGDDSLTGSDGTDSLLGGSGEDDLSGGGAEDSLRGGNGADTLRGGESADLLFGDAGSDVLDGGSGKDTLTGAEGADTMSGGAGRDLFVFLDRADANSSNRDRITDFTVLDLDTIDLRAIDANLRLAGNNTFRFIGSDEFSGARGQLRFETIGGDTVIEGDQNGDGLADVVIVLTGTINLIATDFVL